MPFAMCSVAERATHSFTLKRRLTSRDFDLCLCSVRLFTKSRIHASHISLYLDVLSATIMLVLRPNESSSLLRCTFGVCLPLSYRLRCMFLACNFQTPLDPPLRAFIAT